MAQSATSYDVAVIGAGVNGAGIARDAALRGLRVIVLDKNDMCSGTSAISSRLIHGGLRYLEYAEIPLVYESLHERRCLRQIAGHLVKPLRITIPIFDGARRGRLLVRLGMIAYDLLSFNKRLPRHDMLDVDELQAVEPGLRQTGLLGAARYFDAQVTYAERLVLENLLAARAAGAEIRTHCEVTAIRVTDMSVSSIVYRERDGTETELAVRSVVNAAGPWVDQVLEAAPGMTDRLIGGTKGSHIVVNPFKGAPKDAFYVEAAADGRPFFIIPWNQQYLIGTTDIRYDDSLDEIRASDAEVAYLIKETNRVFPDAKLGIEDINYAYAGVRPLPHRSKGPESAITRRHIIRSNWRIARGLISIIGGKLTTYRNLAEQTVDKLAKVLRQKLPDCRTGEIKLPGAWGIDRAEEALDESNFISDRAATRLLAIYGGRAADIVALAVAEEHHQAALGEDGDILAAEVVFTIREEFAATMTDIVFRRMMIGFDADQGRPYYDALLALAARELDWSTDEAEQEKTALLAYADSLRVTSS
jgi:glycerol-3-phosphate dehydrogenase